MSTINILEIDIGKFTFHLVGHDSSGREVCRKKLSRVWWGCEHRIREWLLVWGCFFGNCAQLARETGTKSNTLYKCLFSETKVEMTVERAKQISLDLIIEGGVNRLEPATVNK